MDSTFFVDREYGNTMTVNHKGNVLEVTINNDSYDGVESCSYDLTKHDAASLLMFLKEFVK